MARRRTRGLLFGAILLLATGAGGCIPAVAGAIIRDQSPPYLEAMKEAPPVPPDRARCMYYWPYDSVTDLATRFSSSCDFTLNGVKYMVNGRMFSFDDLLPGRYDLCSPKMLLSPPKLLIALRVKAGTTYYVRFNIMKQPSLVEEAEALRELATMRGGSQPDRFAIRQEVGLFETKTVEWHQALPIAEPPNR